MNNNNSMKTISMVFGLISLLLSVIGLIVGFFARGGGWMALFGIILGIVAIVLSASAKKNGAASTGGLVMGILGLVFGVIVGVSCLICNCSGYYSVLDTVGEAYDDVDALNDLYNELY